MFRYSHDRTCFNRQPSTDTINSTSQTLMFAHTMICPIMLLVLIAACPAAVNCSWAFTSSLASGIVRPSAASLLVCLAVPGNVSSSAIASNPIYTASGNVVSWNVAYTASPAASLDANAPNLQANAFIDATSLSQYTIIPKVFSNVVLIMLNRWFTVVG